MAVDTDSINVKSQPMPAKLKLGDEVRLSDSSLEMAGEIVAFRDSEYVIVRWFGSKRTTHHLASLERVVVRKHELEFPQPDFAV